MLKRIGYKYRKKEKLTTNQIQIQNKTKNRKHFHHHHILRFFFSFSLSTNSMMDVYQFAFLTGRYEPYCRNQQNQQSCFHYSQIQCLVFLSLDPTITKTIIDTQPRHRLIAIQSVDHNFFGGLFLFVCFFFWAEGSGKQRANKSIFCTFAVLRGLHTCLCACFFFIRLFFSHFEFTYRK